MLVLRSLLWTILLPGMIAGYIPWRYLGVSRVHVDVADPLDVLGVLLIAAGLALLIACIWQFAARGKGTLSPIDPPRALVVQGLYRYVRNPMYLAVSTILLGQALLARSGTILLYWGIFFAMANLFVMLYEEPALRRQFGDSYAQYQQRVGRWLPRIRP
jgi:protein-S-isoprenylcysteine O-methyltransferase Ste14